MLAGTGRWARTYTAIELRVLAVNWAECGDLVTFWDAVEISPDGVSGVVVPSGRDVSSVRKRFAKHVAANWNPDFLRDSAVYEGRSKLVPNAQSCGPSSVRSS